MSHAPLTVLAHLAGPVAYHPEEGVTLDGLLLYSVLLEERGEAFFGPAPGNDEVLAATDHPHPAMPLATSGPEDDWVYCVSQSTPINHLGTERVHWHKRFDDALAQRAIEAGALGTDRKVNTASAEFKSYRMPLYLEHAEALAWHAIGDADEMARLLNTHIHHLGKKRNTGHGAVAGWEVTPSDAHPDRWLWSDERRTQLARPMPLTALPDWSGATAMRSIRPPSWLAAHHRLCAVPELSA